MTGTDGRSHVAVFTTSAAARTARNRHGVAVTGGFALIVNIAPAKRSRIQFVFVVRCRGRNHRAIKLSMVSDRDIKTTFSGIDTALVSDALTTLGDVFARGTDVTGRRTIANALVVQCLVQCDRKRIHSGYLTVVRQRTRIQRQVLRYPLSTVTQRQCR